MEKKHIFRRIGIGLLHIVTVTIGFIFGANILRHRKSTTRTGEFSTRARDCHTRATGDIETLDSGLDRLSNTQQRLDNILKEVRTQKSVD